MVAKLHVSIAENAVAATSTIATVLGQVTIGLARISLRNTDPISSVSE